MEKLTSTNFTFFFLKVKYFNDNDLVKKGISYSCYKMMDKQFIFQFFTGTHRSEMEVYGTNEVKQFCKVLFLYSLNLAT